MKQQVNKLQQALILFQKGQLTSAKTIALKISRNDKKNAQVFHLLALIAKKENDLMSAKRYFEKSIKLDSSFAPVLSNFANLLVDLGNLTLAEKYYKKSTSLDSNLYDAWYNWANLLLKLECFKLAEEKIRKAIQLNPKSQYFSSLAISLREQQRFDEAILMFDKAKNLAINSKQLVPITKNIALTYRAMHEPLKAVQCLNQLVDEDIVDTDVFYVKACAHYDNDNINSAEEDLLKSLELAPENIQAQEALNKLYWESGQDEMFLKSYADSLEKCPNSEPLYASFIKQLILAKKYNKAQDIVERAESVLGIRYSLLYSKSLLAHYAKDSNLEDSFLDHLLKLQPDNTRVRINKANLLIKNSDYKNALKHLDLAGKLEPLNQEIWATKGICWRLLGDARAEWLNDYDKFVSAEFITTPDGYDNLEHFLNALKNALENQHKTNRQPLDQSVQNGTQTVGNLLTLNNKLIQDYKKVLNLRIEKYMLSLPHETNHPFLSRLVKEFRHSGAWSVKLQSGGFHSNHMHPQGWLSNCTYVNVPKNINLNDEDKQGWIKFGETCLELGDKEYVAKQICPSEGLSVLFPSYFWHGTVPFDSQEYRVTLPSDIMPVS